MEKKKHVAVLVKGVDVLTRPEPMSATTAVAAIVPVQRQEAKTKVPDGDDANRLSHGSLWRHRLKELAAAQAERGHASASKQLENSSISPSRDIGWRQP